MADPAASARRLDALTPGRSVPFGREKLPSASNRPWHRHGQAYATVILAGEFEQTGYGGRFRVRAGDVLVQPSLDSHANRMRSAGIDILRLPWPVDATLGGIYRGCDVDALCRQAETDVTAAGALAQAQLPSVERLNPIIEHAADLLAADMHAHTQLPLAAWAEAKGLSREAVSRAFQRLFGVSALQFRMEVRVRGAWRDLLHSDEPLASVALVHGFADQPHFTRALHKLTGLTPAQWRGWRVRSQAFKTLQRGPVTLAG